MDRRSRTLSSPNAAIGSQRSIRRTSVMLGFRSKLPLLAFHETFQRDAGYVEIVTDVRDSGSVWWFAFHCDHCCFETICACDNKRVRVLAALEQLFPFDDLLKVANLEDVGYELAFHSVRSREEPFVCLCPTAKRFHGAIVYLPTNLTC